ncbi:MAG TPA: anti-sigma factor [Gaiellaceae bacterium]|nr:anti-sigma factor [Gaiellaceae bacterium]
MTNEDVHELAAAYALDALAADERQAFESHLAGCGRCRAELASLREAVGALAFSTEGPAPPAALRERILVAAREEPPKVVALRPRRTRLYVGAAAAVAACAALAIGLWAGLSGGGTGPKLALSVGPSGAARLAVSGFDPAPAGKVYEVWVIEGGKPAAAGLFRGGGEQVVRLTRPAPAGSTVAVTLEKAGGVQAPTTAILEQTTVQA